MYWWFVCGLLLICLIIAAYLYDKISVAKIFLTVFVMTFGFCTGMCIGCTCDRGHEQIYKFIEMKQIISCISSEYQDSYLIQKLRVENNEWLAEAQGRKYKYGNWSFYDEEILDLTPIQ